MSALPESVVSSDSVLTAESVCKRVRFGDETIEILRDVSLDINRSESVAICGASGSGKTTLLGILGGMDVPTEGNVLINGANIARMTEEQRAGVRAQQVGFVFQSFQLLSSLSAVENVMLPMELKQQSNARALAEEFLVRVGLGHRINHFPSSLSGGEQQRVAIARAFACHPAILFADEPTGNLDTKTGEKISDLLFELNEEHQTTLVLVTHDEKLAARCGRVIHLAGGSVV